jgi:20S proteasome alpha/beta subunit
MSILRLFAALILVLCSISLSSCALSSDGRYSYSLTTFNPQGRLIQVERAEEAAAQGTPIAAILLQSTHGPLLVMAAPQVLPSPFMIDDGTPRWIQLTSDIVIAHSGIAADGRVLLAAAQKIAIQHEYTWDEEIRIDLLLEDLSLLMQEYTVKPASRPFGAVLLVAHLPKEDVSKQDGESKSKSDSEQDGYKPHLYRVDPSGAVTVYPHAYAVLNGNMERSNLPLQLQDLIDSSKDVSIDDTAAIQSFEDRISSLLHSALQEKKSSQVTAKETNMSMITASLTHASGYRMRRHEL